MLKPDPKAPITRKDLTNATAEIVENVGELLDKHLSPLKKYMDKRFDRVEAKQVQHSRQIDDLKTDLADTPDRKEFNNLKAKVDRFHPTN